MPRHDASGRPVRGLAIAVALVACGGDGGGASKDEYRQKATEIAKKLQTDVQSAQRYLTASDPAEIETGLNQLKASLAQLNTVEADVQPMTDAVRAGDQARGEAAAQKLQTDVRALEQAGNEFDRKVGT